MENQQSSDLYRQFVHDTQINGCIVQVGTAQQIIGPLTSENFEACIKALTGKNAYFLGGVRAGVQSRAKDADITHKNSTFVDFDIRKFWKEKHDEELSDSQLKEVGEGILHSLNSHELLRNWRYAIFSGNGVHIYFFGEPVEITSIENWKVGMKSFLKIIEDCTHIQPDYECVNTARIARLPGSENCKSERKIPVEIIACKQGAIFNVGFIQKLGEKISGVRIDNQPNAKGRIIEGKRNSTLTSLAGLLRHYGHDEGTIFEALNAVNSQRCNPPIDEVEVRKIAQSVSKYAPSKEMDASLSEGAEMESEPIVLCVADVKTEKVGWLWKDRIPKGKLTMLEGDPGLGKSWLSLAITDAVTRGIALPNDEKEEHVKPTDVLLLSAEDGAGDTIRPRLEAIGADLKRIKILTAVKEDNGKERHFSLETDVKTLKKALKAGEYGLIIIDPLNSYLGGVNTYNDAAVRTVLMPLAALAEQFKVAVVCIRHLTKGQRDKAIYRGQGSIAFTGAARAVHLVGIHPQHQEQRVIACSKNNLAPIPPSIAFEIVDGCFVWRGEVSTTAEELVAIPQTPDDQSKISEAEDFLVQSLTASPRLIKEIEEEAKAAGISKSTLKRAKDNLHIKPIKTGGRGEPWAWALPSTSKETNNPNVEPWSSLNTEQNEAQLSIPTGE